MRPHPSARRARYLQLGVPAAILGTLSGTIAAAPASADTTPVQVERHRLSPLGVAVTGATSTSYTVRPGDSVSSIAGSHGLRTEDVLAWNGLTWRSVIYPGQTLTLTGSAAAPATSTSGAAQSHVVVAGDTIYGIAQRYGTSVDAVLAANGLSRTSVIFPGQTIALAATMAPAATAAPSPAPAAGQSHIIVAGDTVYGIARKYGVATADLFAWNGLGPTSIIYPGQSITVAAPAPVAESTAQLAAALDAEQSANAALIIRIGRQLGVSDRGVAIALATAMVESGLRNLDHGDRDSLGLYQQRTSTGWGTPQQLLDAERSTRAFYGGQADPNGQLTRGLLDLPGWDRMAFADAAQAVQISAYPLRYGQWENQAYQWLAQHG